MRAEDEGVGDSLRSALETLSLPTLVITNLCVILQTYVCGRHFVLDV